MDDIRGLTSTSDHNYHLTHHNVCVENMSSLQRYDHNSKCDDNIDDPLGAFMKSLENYEEQTEIINSGNTSHEIQTNDSADFSSQSNGTTDDSFESSPTTNSSLENSKSTDSLLENSQSADSSLDDFQSTDNSLENSESANNLHESNSPGNDLQLVSGSKKQKNSEDNHFYDGVDIVAEALRISGIKFPEDALIPDCQPEDSMCHMNIYSCGFENGGLIYQNVNEIQSPQQTFSGHVGMQSSPKQYDIQSNASRNYECTRGGKVVKRRYKQWVENYKNYGNFCPKATGSLTDLTESLCYKSNYPSHHQWMKNSFGQTPAQRNLPEMSCDDLGIATGENLYQAFCNYQRDKQKQIVQSTSLAHAQVESGRWTNPNSANSDCRKFRLRFVNNEHMD